MVVFEQAVEAAVAICAVASSQKHQDSLMPGKAGSLKPKTWWMQIACRLLHESLESQWPAKWIYYIQNRACFLYETNWAGSCEPGPSFNAHLLVHKSFWIAVSGQYWTNWPINSGIHLLANFEIEKILALLVIWLVSNNLKSLIDK
jgi:hypothetical protein